MRVLVDQNLPRGLTTTFTAWPWVTHAEHTSTRGWGSAPDRTIWAAMSAEAGLIITKDKDFAALSATLGHPPKVVLLRLGNCSAAELVAYVGGAAEKMEAFAAEPTKGLLIIDPSP